MLALVGRMLFLNSKYSKAILTMEEIIKYAARMGVL